MAIKKTETEAQQEDTIDSLIAGLSGLGDEYKVNLQRLEPAESEDGTPLRGHLQDIEDYANLDEEWISKRYGGGKYAVVIKKRNNKGSWIYHKRITLAIAGAPRVKKTATETPRESNPDLVREAMTMQAEVARQERERAERLTEQANKRSPESEMVVQMLRDQLEQTRQDRAALETRLDRLSEESRAPKNDKLLEILTSGKAAEIVSMSERHRSEMEAQRQNYESQLRWVREQQEREVTAIREEHKRIQNTMIEDHKRMVDLLTQTNNHRAQTLELSAQQQTGLYSLQLESAKEEAKRLRSENEKLRAEKQKGFVEQLSEIANVQEALSAIGLGSSGGEEQATWEKVVDKLGAVGTEVVSRLGTAKQQVEVQQQQQLQQQQQQQIAAEQQAKLPFTQQEFESAVDFIESAMVRDQDPKTFAQALSSMVPGALINEISKIEPEQFAAIAEQMKPQTQLSTTKGRVYLRKIHEVLNNPTVATA